MRKVTLIKVIETNTPFKKALFSVTPALSGIGTAQYLVIQIHQEKNTFFVQGHPCDSNAVIKDKEWVFKVEFENNEDAFITALHELIIAVKQSDQINKYLEEE